LEKAKDRINKKIGSAKAVANTLEEYDANTVQDVPIKNDSVFQWFLPSIKKHKNNIDQMI
jgi:hypothetical protein